MSFTCQDTQSRRRVGLKRGRSKLDREERYISGRRSGTVGRKKKSKGIIHMSQERIRINTIDGKSGVKVRWSPSRQDPSLSTCLPFVAHEESKSVN